MKDCPELGQWEAFRSGLLQGPDLRCCSDHLGRCSDCAALLDKLEAHEVLAGRLQALDATAVSLAMDNRMPIVVFDMTVDGNILRALRGETIGTVISDEEPA